MEERLIFTEKEKTETLELLHQLKDILATSLHEGDEAKMHTYMKRLVENNVMQRDVFGLNPVHQSMKTAMLAVEEEGLKRDGVLAILLHTSVTNGSLTLEEVEADFGKQVATIIRGLVRIQDLYKKNPVIESENFRNLLLSFAEDMRVILIMIADRVNLMRQIRDTENEQAKLQVSQEASYLYAPLAHKLGLYKLKSELEDLSLKYLEHDAYYMLKEKLNAEVEISEE